jgi:transposase-like protein
MDKKNKTEKQKQENLTGVLPEDFFKQFKTMSEIENFFEQLFKRGVQELLQGELDDHLGYQKHSPEGINSGNSRNGKTSKVVRSKRGKLTIEVPRDRNSTFEPKVVQKRQHSISDKIEDIVVSLYAKGMSVRDIEEQIKEIYGVELSDSTVSNMTERILVNVEEWQTRPLDETYLIAWMDGIVFKVRSNGKIVNKTVYLVIGLNTKGRKELLGMWINETENASFWMNVLSEIKQRGVNDILIACTDNLKGLTQAIKASFPEVVSQLCIVHQIRNSLRFVTYKDKREFMADLKAIYATINIESAQEAMNKLESKWNQKYPHVIKSWLKNWDELTAYFNFPKEIRTIMYTTNIIESLNSLVRKFTRNKTMFPDDNALKKAVYLAIQQASKKWTNPIRNWPLIANQFTILYQDRAKIFILPLRR